MDGQPAEVIQARLAPGFVGLYQINFVVPDQLGGDVRTFIRVGRATSNETVINVGGSVDVEERYSGVLQPRNSAEKLQLNVTSVAEFSSGGLFTASYTVTRAGAVVDTGTLSFQPTNTTFLIEGKSTTGRLFFGVMDTFDAGRRFSGIFLQDPLKPDTWYGEFTIAANSLAAVDPHI
jgi:hypothetical protein